MSEPAKIDAINIEESAAFLDAIIEHIPNMIFVKSAKGLKFIRFNKAGEDLIGIPRAQMLGKNDYDFFPKADADFFTQKDNEVLEKGELLDIAEEALQTRHGKRILHTKKVPLVLENGQYKYLLGISEDITTRKMAERKLEAAMLDLERSNKDLEQFAYVASHDLQEPLRMMSNFCQLLHKEYKDKLDEQALVYIDYVVEGARRMHNTIDALLSYAKVGRSNMSLQEVDLNAVMQDVLLDLSVRIKESRAKVHVQALPVVLAHRVQITQVFENLIHNALKFKSQRDLDISVKVDKIGDFWKFFVSDNGIGIKEEFYEKIFLFLARLNPDEAFEGRGIGLAICKKVIESHGGAIGVNSVFGQGTTFFFTLSVKDD